MPNPGVFKKASDTNTITSKNTHTLIWEVDSYTPVIEYSLWFRPYKTGRGLNRPEWTKLTIPAEHSSGTVYSKSYTLRALKERTIYEVLLVSRNRYGWSKPSPILRFATAGAGTVSVLSFSTKKLKCTLISELKEDFITTVQLNAEDNNVIPLNYKSTARGLKGCLLIIFNLLLIKL